MKIAVLTLPADQYILVLSDLDPAAARVLNEHAEEIRSATGAKATFVVDGSVEVAEMQSMERLEQLKETIREYLAEYEATGPDHIPDLSGLEAAVAEPSQEWTPEETARLRALLAEPSPFAGRVRDLLAERGDVSPEDIELGVVPDGR